MRADAASESWIVEARGETAGIVTRDGQSWRFHASVGRFAKIDGQRFASPRDAEKAAGLILDAPAGKPRPDLSGEAPDFTS